MKYIDSKKLIKLLVKLKYIACSDTTLKVLEDKAKTVILKFFPCSDELFINSCLTYCYYQRELYTVSSELFSMV